MGAEVAIGYRAVLRLGREQNAVTAAEEQVRAWLRSKAKRARLRKGPAEWDGPGFHAVGRGSDLLVVHADHDEDTPRRLYRLTEVNAAGRWIVSIYAGVLPEGKRRDQIVVVEVELVDTNREAALEKVTPPAIVRALLDTYDADDGFVRLTGSPTVIRSGQTAELLAVIENPGRKASVVVALSPARDLDDSWRQVVGSLTRQSVGVAAAYVVYFDAMDEFNKSLPESHRVRAGEIRTFVPGVDLDSPSDAIRHKWLSLPALTRSLRGKRVSDVLQRRHGEEARRRFVETELPAGIQRMIELLRRAETGTDRAARVEALVAKERKVKPGAIRVASGSSPITVVETKWQERLALVLRRWLGIEAAEPRHLEQLDSFIESKVAEVTIAAEQLAEVASDVEVLEGELLQLRRQKEDMELEWAIAREAQQTVGRENSVLRQRLARSDRPEDAYVEPEEEIWEAPSSVEDLTKLLTAGPGEHQATARIEFVGSPAGAVEIDRRYPSGVYATAFWQHVQTLHDYVLARESGFSGGVHLYLTSDHVEGAKCPPGQHAAKESDSVLNNSKWRSERVFSVPQQVHPDARVLMEAHFKPTWRDTFAPRMYYYDDVSGTGKIYIGYIGRHLTNTQS